MKHPKTQVQPESTEKQKGHKPPIQSQKTTTPNLTDLSQTGLQHLSPADILALQRTIGNRAVARLMAQRERGEELEYPGPRSQREGEEEEEDEQTYPGPRSKRAGEDVLEYPGPRMKSLRENGVQQRGVTGLSSSPAQRASPASSASGEIGDAIDVDGQAMYGWTRSIDWSDVETVVNGVIPTMSEEGDTEPVRIVIY